MTIMLSKTPDPVAAAAAAARLIRTVRRSFRRFGRAVDRLHADLGVTAAMRVVLEMVTEQGPMTVPQMARRKGLSRQHFQTKVDALRARGLVAVRQNPRHARSVLIELTDEGRTVFAEMGRREAAALARVVQGLDRQRIEEAERLLAEFSAAFAVLETQQEEDQK